MCKKLFNKLLIGLIILVTLCMSFSVSTNVFAKTSIEEKVYCGATLDDDFSDNRVLVVLNEASSYINNVYDENIFSNYECNDVTELTYMATSLIQTHSNNSLIDTNNYNKVLCLELEKKSKSNVLNVIDSLMQRDDVIYAGPDYKIAINSITPNDSSLNYQWAIDSIELPKV